MIDMALHDGRMKIQKDFNFSRIQNWIKVKRFD